MRELPPVRELVLHIGRHKSGTTALQHWCDENRRALRQAGFVYPTTGTHNGRAHHLLATAVSTLAPDDPAIADLANELRRKGQRTGRLLLSSEAFQKVKNTATLQALIAQLGQPSVRVICYIREHLDYAMSAWRQLVQRQNQFVPFADFCNRFTSIVPFVARWRAVGQLDLAWYDRRLLLDGDIVAEFCTRIGLPVGAAPAVDPNPSIGGNLLVFKLAANLLAQPGGNYTALTRLALREPRFRAPFRVTAEAAETLRANSAYNQSAIAALGPVPMREWSGEPTLPDLSALDDDLDRIGAALGLPIDRAFRECAHGLGPAFDLSPPPALDTAVA